MRYPKTMQDFFERFSNNEKCLDYLVEVKWNGGFVCPHCSHTQAWKIRRSIFKCKECRREVSVTAGTTFHKSKIPLQTWFQAIWLMVSQKNGVSALGLSQALGIKRQMTGWYLVKRIRSAMVRIGREKLSGTVEVDEVLIGGVKQGKRGRGAYGKILILVAVEDKGEQGIGRIRIIIIPDASSKSLTKAIESTVEKGSMIRTDGWSGYSAITNHGFRHTVIKRQPAEPGDDPTPLVHRIASLLKRWLLGTHQGGVRSHISAYLEEYVFRFNRRRSHSRGKLFYRLVQNMVDIR